MFKHLFLRLPIFTKVFLFALLLISLSGTVFIIMFFSNKILEERDDARLLKIAMDKAIINNNLFFTLKDTLYSKRVLQNISEAREILSDYISEPVASLLDKNIVEFGNIFKQKVKNEIERGLSETQGAEGDLRFAVHKIEEIVKQLNQKDIHIDMLTARRAEKDFFLREKDKYIRKVKEAVLKLLAHSNSASISVENKKEIEKLANIYQNKFLYASKLIIEKNLINSELNKVISKNDFLISELVKKKESKASVYVIISLVLIISSIFIGIIIAYLISRLLSNPIINLTKYVKKIEEGDYNAVILTESQDEIGILSRSINEMVDKIKKNNDELVLQNHMIEERVKEAVEQLYQQNNYLEKKIETILKAMQEFSAGNLLKRLEIQKDDAIGKLFNGFNESVENIKDIIVNVQLMIMESSKKSTDIFVNSNEVAEGAYLQKNKITDLLRAIEYIEVLINENSKLIEKAYKKSLKSGSIAKEGGSVVKNTISDINQISDEVILSVEIVKSLGEKSQNIGEIIDVIDEIADQTNLLALNAAIEAARAGELGKGFAVVADEVKKLADRTTLSTKKITEMVSQIQAESKTAIESIKRGEQIAENGKKSAFLAENSLQEIIKSTQEVTQIFEDVVKSGEKHSSEIHKIRESIELISTVTSETVKNTDELKVITENLSVLNRNLEIRIGKFKIKEENNNIYIKANKSRPDFELVV